MVVFVNEEIFPPLLSFWTLCLLFFPNLPSPTFIPDPTFISDPRVRVSQQIQYLGAFKVLAEMGQ